MHFEAEANILTLPEIMTLGLPLLTVKRFNA